MRKPEKRLLQLEALSRISKELMTFIDQLRASSLNNGLQSKLKPEFVLELSFCAYTLGACLDWCRSLLQDVDPIRQPFIVRLQTDMAILFVGKNARSRGMAIKNHTSNFTIKADLPLFEFLLVGLLTHHIKSGSDKVVIEISSSVKKDCLYVSLLQKEQRLNSKSSATISTDTFFLSLCRYAVKCFGGDLWLKEDRQANSIISFTIPCDE